MLTEQFRPGCFASPLCYGEINAVCRQCPHQAECGTAAEACSERLRALCGMTNVAGLDRRRPAPVMMAPRPVVRSTPAKPRAIVVAPAVAGQGTLPKKGEELLAALTKRGVDLRAAALRRENPFETQPPRHLRVLFNLLLAGGFTRAEARQSLVTELSWTGASASSNAGSAIAVLLAAGAVQDIGGRITIVEAVA